MEPDPHLLVEDVKDSNVGAIKIPEWEIHTHIVKRTFINKVLERKRGSIRCLSP